VKIFTGNTAIIKDVNARPFSTKKRSDEITVMNFPELVEMSDFMERLATLSNMTATRVLLTLMDIMAPF
jgi:hypothetical protein